MATVPNKPWYWRAVTETLHNKPNDTTDPAQVCLPDGYTVLITGAGAGIGAHIARAYVLAKASNIIITARTVANLERVKKGLEDLASTQGRTVSVTCLPSDASRPETYARLRNLIEASYSGRLDCLICNAGGLAFKSGWSKDISSLDLDEFIEGTALNYEAAVYAAKYLVPCLLHPEAKGRTIINVTSGASNLTNVQLAPPQYSISKLALNRITQMLAENYEAEGIVAVALNPGGVLTPGTDAQTNEDFKKLMTDDPGLCGAVCVWISKERPLWASGRYVSATWDMDELKARKDEIVEHDKFKFRMVI